MTHKKRRKSITLNKEKRKNSSYNQRKKKEDIENTSQSKKENISQLKKENNTISVIKEDEISLIIQLTKTLTHEIRNKEEECLSIYIDSISFFNFKSYKGLHKISMLDKRFNVIVGPNGSGKSNIIDGIQFLFGYTAKKMRHLTIGNLVNDLSKTDSYVEMIIKGEITINIYEEFKELNNNNNEIILKRTVNKSGKSIYYINNIIVTNKIMIKFLMKLGIDTKTNRFLILQGEIENIGLLKPKSDQIFKPNYKPFIIDISIEEEVIKIMNEEIEFNNNFGLLEYFEQIIGTLNFNLKIQKLKEISIYLNEKLESEKPTYFYNKKEYEKLIKEIEKEKELQKDYYLFINKVKRYKYLKEKIEEEIKEKNHKEILKIKKENEKENNLIEKENNLIKKILKEFNELKEEEILIKENIKKGNSFINKIESSFNNLNEKKIEINNLEDLSKKELKNEEKELKNKEEGINKINSKLKIIKLEKNKEEELKKEELKEEIKKTNNKISNKINEEKELEEVINLIKKEEEKLILLNNSINNFNLKDNKSKYKEIINNSIDFNKIEETTNKIINDILIKKNILKETELEYQTIKSTLNSNSILKLLINIKGVHGMVVDLIKVPTPFKNAFISSCRGLLNNIVVDSKAVANECIKILKMNNKRCTFLVLKEFKEFEAKPIYINSEDKDLKFFELTNKYHKQGINYLMPLYYYIHCNSIYYSLFKSFINTYLCPDSLLKYIAFKKNLRAVNQDGMVIERSGVMYKYLNSNCKTFNNECGIRNCYCGSNKNNNSIEERRNLKEIEKELNNKEEEINYLKEIEIYLNKIKEKEIIKKRINELNKNILLKESINKIKEEIKNYKNELNNLKIELMKYQTPFEKNIKLKYEVENQIIKLKEKIKRDNLNLNNKKRQKEDLEISLFEEINEYSKINKLNFKDLKIEEIKKKTNEFLINLIHKETEAIEKIETLKIRIKNLKNNLTKLFNNQFEREKEIERLKQLGLELKNQEIDYSCLNSNSNNNSNNKIEDSYENNNNNDMLEKIKILESKCEELRFLSEKYLKNNSNKKLISIPTPNFNFIEISNSQIEIFLKFINKFEKLEEIQRDLNYLIETLKNLRRKLFQKEFEIIKQKFKLIYRTLTFGGNAEIELLNYLDPFDGLQLSVMPLKKTWTSVRNLSGGERTLTSLALLFAIQYSKPSPFYFLDEIDAALDYRNVSVIANFLIMEKAQFIIISLRNDMVEKAKQLIGVCKTKTESQIICLTV